MRILNRPMFRYGGPIREGIMHGMRNGGRTLAGGNQIGTPMGNRTGFKNPLSWKSQIATKIPAVGNIYKKGLANWGNIFNKIKDGCLLWGAANKDPKEINPIDLP